MVFVEAGEGVVELAEEAGVGRCKGSTCSLVGWREACGGEGKGIGVLYDR